RRGGWASRAARATAVLPGAGGQQRRPKAALAATPDVEVESEAELLSDERIQSSMELLAEYSEERHPGHTPGRFAGPGPEYDAMEFDGVRWKMRPQLGEGGEATSTALARLSQNDQA
ncbi:unnamed protein product, partial [Prorocentrum cordatum]